VYVATLFSVQSVFRCSSPSCWWAGSRGAEVKSHPESQHWPFFALSFVHIVEAEERWDWCGGLYKNNNKTQNPKQPLLSQVCGEISQTQRDNKRNNKTHQESRQSLRNAKNHRTQNNHKLLKDAHEQFIQTHNGWFTLRQCLDRTTSTRDSCYAERAQLQVLKNMNALSW
jgi:hypothetical protein